MPRGLVIFLCVCGLVAVIGLWGLPWLKQAMFGESIQTQCVVTMAVDDYEVQYKNVKGQPQTVSRTVLGLQLDFPMGSAPENTKELVVKDYEGHIVEVEWPQPDQREDIPDKRITRWVFKEVFFPLGFRQGELWNQNRELAAIKVPPPPYNAP